MLLIVTIVDYEPPVYGDYEYPGWALAVGWQITIWPVNTIPAYMIYYLIQKGTGEVLYGTIRANRIARWPTADRSFRFISCVLILWCCRWRLS